jgi:hypothetical protein
MGAQCLPNQRYTYLRYNAILAEEIETILAMLLSDNPAGAAKGSGGEFETIGGPNGYDGNFQAITGINGSPSAYYQEQLLEMNRTRAWRVEYMDSNGNSVVMLPYY